MKKIQIMTFITSVTYLHIGIQHGRLPLKYFVVLNSNPNERKPVWMGVVCWLAQIPLLMGVVLGFLGTASLFAEGYGLKATIICALITGLSAWGLNKVDGLFEKRPSWDKEDYVPTDEEWEDWHHWVHCEEEYQAWGN